MKQNSQRIPGKNLKLLNGQPLYFYIADTLLNSACFERLVINTDSSEIAETATKRYGDWVIVSWRKRSLLGDEVSMNRIIEQDLMEFSDDEHFLQTHSTNPMLSRETIKKAVVRYKQNLKLEKADSLFSVSLIRSRLYKSDLSPINHSPDQLIQTQQLEPVLEENSCFYIFSKASFKKSKARIGLNPLTYNMDKSSVEAVDIDYPEDWRLASLILKSRAEK